MIYAEKYFNKWKIKINQEKTQAIIFLFNKSPKRISLTTFNIQGTLIAMNQNVKYLGIFLNKYLTFKYYILQTHEKALKCWRALYSILLNRKSQLNTKNKLTIQIMYLAYNDLWLPSMVKKIWKKHT